MCQRKKKTQQRTATNRPARGVSIFEAGKKESSSRYLSRTAHKSSNKPHGSAALYNNPAKSRRHTDTTLSISTSRSISEVGYTGITHTQPLLDIDTTKRCASDGPAPASHSFQPNKTSTKLCWPRPCPHFPSSGCISGRYQYQHQYQGIRDCICACIDSVVHRLA